MSDKSDRTMLGLTEETHRRLSELKDDGVFKEMADGYRLGIAHALEHGLIDPASNRRGKTTFSTGTIDPDGVIAAAISEMIPASEGLPYEIAERLAEAGLKAIAEKLARSVPVSAAIAPAATT